MFILIFKMLFKDWKISKMFNTFWTGYVLIKVKKLSYTIVNLSQWFTNLCPKLKYAHTQQNYL